MAQARDLLKRVRPESILGLFCVPWRKRDYDDAISKVIGQDFRALSQFVDVFSPMAYHLMCGQSPDWIGAVTEEIHTLQWG